MTSAALLTDAFERVRESAVQAVAGLTVEQLGVRLDADAGQAAFVRGVVTRTC